MTEEDPSKLLPRDKTGSYLHLKLKRFGSIKDLSMPFAKKTWRDTPHDAEVDISPSNRSSCRQCHSKIEKGDLRMRLWLQCHKGCKISAYFHGNECFWKYPETIKPESVNDLVGLKSLREDQQDDVRQSFGTFLNKCRGDETPAKKKLKVKHEN